MCNIPLSGKLGKGLFAKIDANDFVLVSSHRWVLSHGYPCTYLPGGKKVYLHRLIMNCGPNEMTDHKNRNKLDNRKSNLRKCTPAVNSYNRACKNQYRGVYWSSSHCCWVAQFGLNGDVIFLGHFDNAESAALAYNMAAIKAGVDPEILNVVGKSVTAEKRKRIGSSNYKGVSFHKLTGKWRAYISRKKRQIYLGLFKTELQAANAVTSFQQGEGNDAVSLPVNVAGSRA